MKNNKKTIRFQKHILIEQLLRERLDDLKKATADETTSKYGDGPKFYENIGDVEVFSVREVENLWNKAEHFYGDDRKRYARNLLQEAIKNGNRKNLAVCPLEKDIDRLEECFPNFQPAIELIRAACALSNLTESKHFLMSPILLAGDPGLGKTAFSQSFSEIIQTNFKRLDVGGNSTSSIINGLSLGWGSGHPGEIFKILTESNYANPLILLDEIDKIAGHESTPLNPVLLALLEKESARTFTDEALLLKMNCSQILWFASANYVEQISKPLLSRFQVVQITSPTPEQSRKIINSIYMKIRENSAWGRCFVKSLDENVVDALTELTPRLINTTLIHAFGAAALRQDNQIKISDCKITKQKRIYKIGFI